MDLMRFNTAQKKQKYSNMNKYPQEFRATGVDAVQGKLPTDGLFVKNELLFVNMCV
jgi:hypothetical protein